MSNTPVHSPRSSQWAKTLLAPFVNLLHRKRKIPHSYSPSFTPNESAHTSSSQIPYPERCPYERRHSSVRDRNRKDGSPPQIDSAFSSVDDLSALSSPIAAQSIHEVTVVGSERPNTAGRAILLDELFSENQDVATGKEDVDSRAAIAAWNHNFNGRRHVKLGRTDKELFAARRRLGGGGVGIVHETHIDGIALALKRTYAQRLTRQQLNEVDILRRISKNRHRHVVELIGSYTHQQRGQVEIGLLIWPVACIDLAKTVRSFEILIECLSTYQQTKATAELLTAVEPLSWLTTAETEPRMELAHSARILAINCQSRIRQSIGCIAEAVAYLHGHRIRHKDLKPSQILLSPHGLWLTDFGFSADFSDLPDSFTSGVESMTMKYQAPERANHQSRGRAEDVFALGCIFLEMAYALVASCAPMKLPRPWSQTGWSFQANLRHRQEWLEPLDYGLLTSDEWQSMVRLQAIINAMLAPKAKDRPSINVIIETTRSIRHERHGLLFACLCSPAVSSSTDASV